MKRAIWECVKVIGLGFILAVIATATFEPTRIEGTSMYPTIDDSNMILLNKATYLTNQPKDGDIVVFKAKVYTEHGEGKLLIKRIIGLAGDKIAIKDGKVYRNGKTIIEDYVSSENIYENYKEITIKKDHVFVLGDNRVFSLDSRDDSIGQVPIKDIVGKADLKLFPMSEIAPL